jgi:hypothetical protein
MRAVRSPMKWTTTAGALAIGAFACSSSTSNHASSACMSKYDALIAASDYSSSAIGGCDLDGGAALPFSGIDLGTDPALATSGGRAFFIARESPSGSVIFELDPECATPRAEYSAEDPNSTGYSDAQDVAVTSTGALWIPRFNVPTLLVLDSTGHRTATIDLSSYDPDGNPNMSAIQIAQVGGAEKAFVALERLDDKTKFTSILPSSIVRIDVATRTVEAAMLLQGRDPFGAIAENAGAFFLAAPGSFDIADEKDAGIERFDPVTFTTTYLLGETELGASATEVAVNGSCGVAIVADPTPAVNATSLITFDADKGTTITTAKNPLLSTAGFDLAALAWQGDVLLVGDRRAGANGKYPVHLFDRTGTCDLTERPDMIFISQKPVGIRAVQ